MSVSVKLEWDKRKIAELSSGRLVRAVARALSKAGSTALRDMRSEATKRIKRRKRLKAGIIAKSFRMRRPKGSTIESMEWALDISGKPVPLIAYPHRERKEPWLRPSQRGVTVEVNKGKRTLVKGAFIATMRSGHVGIFKRFGPGRLPIFELLGSRPVDALLHKGEAEAIAERGKVSFGATFERLLPIEMGKVK